jgi:hypothetical protein
MAILLMIIKPSGSLQRGKRRCGMLKYLIFSLGLIQGFALAIG